MLWLLLAQDIPVLTGPPAGVPWWAWLLSTILATVIGGFVPKTYDYLLKKFQIQTDSERAQKASEASEQKRIIEEYRKVLRFQEQRIDKLEKQSEQQNKELTELADNERECLSRCEKLSNENAVLRERLDNHEDAMTNAGIKFKSHRWRDSHNDVPPHKES